MPYLFHLLFSTGAFTPVTMDGHMVVNGILTSCYAFPDHHLAHIVMAPIRYFPEIIMCLFGEDINSPVYVKTIENMGRWMLPFTEWMN